MQVPHGTKTELTSLLYRPIVPTQQSTLPEGPGVYLWTFVNDRKETLYYVGRARNVRYRVSVHMDLMFGSRTSIGTSVKHSRAAVKYRESARVFLLEDLGVDSSGKKDTLASLERFWILYFWRLVGSKNLLNVEVVPNRFRMDQKTRERMSTMHKVRFTQNPESRKLMSDKVTTQWEDPAFREANLKRMEDLRSSGWTPAESVVYKVKLPTGKTYKLYRQDIGKFLGIGCRPNGFLSFFKENPLLSDWRVTEYMRVAGYKRQTMDPSIHAEYAAFLKDPFIAWFSEFRSKAAVVHWARAQPCLFHSDSGTMKTFSTTNFRKGGQVRVPGGQFLKRFTTLYEFAKDPNPILY